MATALDRTSGFHMPGSREDSNHSSFLRDLKQQWITIHALILRDLHSKYGRHNIGYLWMIGEPLMLSTVIALLHVIEPNHYTSDIQPAPFAIIGYTVYIIFRGIFSKAEAIVDGNVPILYHRQISIFDILVARAAIEATGCFLCTFILLSIAIVMDMAQFPARPLYLLGAIGLMIWWSFALSMIAARVSYQNETMGRQLHVIAYFALPFSASFFQLSSIPSWMSSVLQWFPMTLIFEQARYGQFRAASGHYVSVGYVSFTTGCLTYIGLILIRRLRRNL